MDVNQTAIMNISGKTALMQIYGFTDSVVDDSKRELISRIFHGESEKIRIEIKLRNLLDYGSTERCKMFVQWVLNSLSSTCEVPLHLTWWEDILNHTKVIEIKPDLKKEKESRVVVNQNWLEEQKKKSQFEYVYGKGDVCNDSEQSEFTGSGCESCRQESTSIGQLTDREGRNIGCVKWQNLDDGKSGADRYIEKVDEHSNEDRWKSNGNPLRDLQEGIKRLRNR